MFRRDFFEAWRYVPPLLISVVFGAMTGFLGSICLAYKDSRAMGIATGIGALVNVVLNALLIPVFSAMGAAVATAVSYFIMFSMAFYFVSRYVKLSVEPVRDIPAIALLVGQAVVMTGGEGGGMTYSVCALSFALLILIYFKWIKRITLLFMNMK